MLVERKARNDTYFLALTLLADGDFIPDRMAKLLFSFWLYHSVKRGASQNIVPLCFRHTSCCGRARENGIAPG
ncbi:hypothetical protein M1E08_13665 [Erwinia sp. PK3-005]|uniref:Uncharacterized protein n=1 Tax=Mixta hanseatica TaxID=2872648 RepID=A0ABY4RFC6_9GAMM|nr:hypothetical protein [Mixta hanseatica]UQY45550.1 hypothetical protein K6958_07805 [Mixta hanseatica]